MKFKLSILLFLFAALFAACGPPPQPGVQQGDFLEIAMVGTLVETGDEFINTEAIGQPIIFPYGEGVFFPGWDGIFEGKQVGDKISVDIPSEDAFGATGAPPAIPPDADLHFEIEILNILTVDKEILEAGDGPQPEDGQTVRVHYTGTLEDGTEFDSSAGRDPIEFPLGAGFVIPGWDIAIGTMQVGEKAILTIPPGLAYGPQGSPPNIPPNATLIFEVELVEIVAGP